MHTYLPFSGKSTSRASRSAVLQSLSLRVSSSKSFCWRNSRLPSSASLVRLSRRTSSTARPRAFLTWSTSMGFSIKSMTDSLMALLRYSVSR